MSKIFRYECRRLLWNKFFIGLAVVLLLYGALVLHAVTILGVSHTAPFSPWSFGDYLSRMLPLLWIGMLFFLTFYTSPKARRAAVLTDAAPMPSEAVRLGPVRRGPDGRRAAESAVHGRGGGVLRPYVPLVRLGGVFCSRLWRPFCPPLCSHWGAAGCWGRSGPGWCMCGWRYPS